MKLHAVEECGACERLENIGMCAFQQCSMIIEHISIPSTVRLIGVKTFCHHMWLKEVELSEGLENIDTAAFVMCVSLKCIQIPSTTSHQIDWSHDIWLLHTQLKEVELCKKLASEILYYTFGQEEILDCIKIPSLVKSLEL